jgi:Protein kinase domain
VALESLTVDDPGEVGPYGLRGRLGAGGMGIVYLGFDGAGGAVAVKTLMPNVGPDLRRRLRREAELLAGIRHPRVAQFLDADVAADRPWIAMHYVPGPSLADAPVPLAEAPLHQLADGLAEPLAALHRGGLHPPRREARQRHLDVRRSGAGRPRYRGQRRRNVFYRVRHRRRYTGVDGARAAGRHWRGAAGRRVGMGCGCLLCRDWAAAFRRRPGPGLGVPHSARRPEPDRTSGLAAGSRGGRPEQGPRETPDGSWARRQHRGANYR